MSPLPSPHQHPDVAPRGRRVGVVLATLLLVPLLALLTGCGLRAETPPPAEPSPSATEQVRARTAVDAAALAEAARTVALTPAGAAEPVAGVLADLAAFSDQHAEQAGGRYVSGLPTPTTSPTAPPSTGPADVTALLAALAAATTTALTDADAVDDGPLARLVASIATSRAELTTRLAQAAGLPVPTVDPGPPTAAPTATATAPAAPVADPADLTALALAHDQAGYGFEVIAAKLSGDQRAVARASAATHRAEGDRWARAAGADGTAEDPRRASYALPTGLDDPTAAVALGRLLETSVADAAATAVASATVGGRSAFIDGLRAATTAANAWGATPVPFPGLPEQTQPPTG